MMRVAVVTGARSGLGVVLTRRLLKEGWSVAALVRSPLPDDADLTAAIAAGTLRIYTGDLADQTSRGAVAEAIERGEPKIDVLFNVAGISTGQPQTSPQGIELHYEVNTIAPYALTTRLLPNLEAAGLARVINVSTSGVHYVKAFDPTKLARPHKRFRKLFGAYSDSKLALSLWSKAIAPELAARNITILSVDPGANKTSMTRGDGMPTLLLPLARLFFKPPSYGAGLLLAAATAPYCSGDFLSAGKARQLPWEEKASEVLAVIRKDFERISSH